MRGIMVATPGPTADPAPIGSEPFRTPVAGLGKSLASPGTTHDGAKRAHLMGNISVKVNLEKSERRSMAQNLEYGTFSFTNPFPHTDDTEGRSLGISISSSYPKSQSAPKQRNMENDVGQRHSPKII